MNAAAPKSAMTPVTSEFHPAANLFPLMDEEALAELAADIATNGLRDPIWRHPDGRIIDGRNRWLACQKAGVVCRHRTYEKGDDTIVSYVVSHNLHRRHLTTAQRAAIAVDIATMRQGARTDLPSIEGRSQPEAAKLVGVSVASVERAAAVKRADPELHEKVKAGEVTAGAARREIAPTQARVEVAKDPVVEPLPPEPDAEGQVDAAQEDQDDLAPPPSNGDHALAAITAMAKLKISGTAAARDYEWDDDDLRLAEKACTWIKMFTHVAQRERHRMRYARPGLGQ